MNLIFDLETDGLLDTLTKIHCLCIYDLDAKETYTFNDQGNKDPIVRGVEMLADADCIIGHNILHFDIPVINVFIHGSLLLIWSILCYVVGFITPTSSK